MSDIAKDSTEPVSGEWIGSLNSLSVREPGPDADGPILELHGDEGSVAAEVSDEAFAVGLSRAGGEIRTILDRLDEVTDDE